MPSESNSEFLVLLLGTELTIELRKEEPDARFSANGIDYYARDGGTIAGFYDWLRAESGFLVGIRYTPLAEAGDILVAAQQKPYARVAPDQSSLEIFFSTVRDVDDSKSMDQAFGGSGEYVSAAGDIALVFDTYALSDLEIDTLRSGDQSAKS